jgi:hypothetical protein
MQGVDQSRGWNMPLTDLEQLVIWIGFSAKEPAVTPPAYTNSYVARLRKLVFGDRAVRRLADNRLETLRVMAAATRDRPDAPDPKAISAFFEAGWTFQDLGRIHDLAVQRRRASVHDCDLLVESGKQQQSVMFDGSSERDFARSQRGPVSSANTPGLLEGAGGAALSA